MIHQFNCQINYLQCINAANRSCLSQVFLRLNQNLKRFPQAKNYFFELTILFYVNDNKDLI